MIYTDIKANGDLLHVSKLAIGSAVRMQALSKEELFSIYDCYLEYGGNCIDTARAYAGGRAEELVGEYMKIRGNRNRIIVSTKCGHPNEDGKSRLSYEEMKSDLDTSLKALNTDHVDIYWVHKDDTKEPVEGIIDGLNRLLKSGKIRMIGASNWTVERIASANNYAKESGQIGFGSSQIQWSFADTLSLYFQQYTSLVMDDDSYEWYKKHEMPVFAFSAQAQGFFQKFAAGGLASLDMEVQRNYGSPENMRRLARAQKYAREHEVPLAVPILGYLIQNEVTCIPIIGSDNKEMLLESLLAGEKLVTPEDACWLARG